MLDFVIITQHEVKKGLVEIYPKFIVKKSSDLMIRGQDFYAIWVEERGLWSTDEQDAIRLIDNMIDDYVENTTITNVYVKKYMWDASSGMIDRWHKYCQKQMRDNYTMLDEELVFANTVTSKKSFASKKLDYPLEPCETPAYEKLISTLYTKEEREKIEWAIGAIISGDSKKIQKFLVLYGSAGTGKSTILNIIQQLFNGYYSTFDARSLGSSSDSFALEAFRTNPLVAIQHDGDLSRIEDNTRLNSLVSHELMTVNEKFKQTYTNRFKSFLFMGTNKPVRITDAKSGLIRRLIDVTPSGNKLSIDEYNEAVSQANFELGGIAYHCLQFYKENPNRYENYIPVNMIEVTNDFYNFMIDSYHIFKKDDSTTLKTSWEMYKNYCTDANVSYPYSQRIFKEELKNYFKEYRERFTNEDGTRVRNYYFGLREEKFRREEEKKNDSIVLKNNDVKNETGWLVFHMRVSLFDREAADYPAQYAKQDETPSLAWDKVTTKLSDIDTSKIHYVRVPENHIVIDFDLKDENGNKSLELNIKEANKWPKTYAEVSKGGNGIHLHYIYNGDPSKLSRVYSENIEIKVFTGKSSLRRRLSMCNDIPIAVINSGLPLRKEEKMVNFEVLKSEKSLRTLIKRNLAKEIHPGTKPSVDFIYKILDDAYNSGLKYDVSDMKNQIIAFCACSTHNADYCLNLATKMKFKSEETSESEIYEKEAPIVFFDVEVFPNLFLICLKARGINNSIVRFINPRPKDIEDILKFRLVGFNCRRYDNHMLWACMMGYSPAEIYNLSQRIIGGDKNAFFGEAYNISYTDIYDFASAGNKKSLKKLEIEMSNKANDPESDLNEDVRQILSRIKHHELGLPWNEPVPEELWEQVAEYCGDDVYATEASFEYLKSDWTARMILADLAGMSVNDTTNALTTRIIFGKEKNPQKEFRYRNLAEPVMALDEEMRKFLEDACPVMMSKRHGPANSLLPYFPGYKYERGKSTYRDEEVGEGGYVYSEQGIHVLVALLDITSMHPHSTIAECLFGPRFTARYKEIIDGRVDIKHEAWNEVNHILNGVLTPYIQKVIDGELTSKELANALKTAINSVYGLTSASFNNAFRDPLNVDNIVAKRGALFMINLKHEVQERGFTVAHIKTDSIKIPNATPEIIKFVMDYGKEYGYNFEHEATYDRMCLVNDAVYVAKYATEAQCEQLYGYVPDDNKKKGGKWTATGTQFQIPYVFKTLFSKKDILFSDMCEVKSVTSALYLDMNEKLQDISEYEKQYDKATKSFKAGSLTVEEYGSLSTELAKKIAEGHDYHFVGKVGQFCPIKSGSGGGLLVREKDGKYYAAGGSKGYRWMESDMVKTLNLENEIDRSYYDELVTQAANDISKYGDLEWFLREAC